MILGGYEAMKKRITITLSPEVVKQAKIHAVKEDTNLSALIECLLVKWLVANGISRTSLTKIKENCE